MPRTTISKVEGRQIVGLLGVPEVLTLTETLGELALSTSIGEHVGDPGGDDGVGEGRLPVPPLQQLDEGVVVDGGAVPAVTAELRLAFVLCLDRDTGQVRCTQTNRQTDKHTDKQSNKQTN